MRILSIDVGIKNMALCVFVLNENTWCVEQWKTVNLMPDTNINVSPECSCLLLPKKKTPAKQCGKKAAYLSPSNLDVGYCNKHANALVSEGKYMMPNKEHTESWWKKQPVADVNAEYVKLGFSPETAGSKIAKPKMVEQITKYYAERTLIPVVAKKTKSAKEVSLVDVGRAIKTALIEIKGELSFDYVIIENQISTIAARMKTIQGMIAQTFIMLDADAKTQIEFISSSNKLKGLIPMNSGEKDKEQPGTKEKYKANKNDGVRICGEFIAKNAVLSKWQEQFHGSKKKDDLADCFLQGIWFLKSRKYITYADDLGINCVK